MVQLQMFQNMSSNNNPNKGNQNMSSNNNPNKGKQSTSNNDNPNKESQNASNNKKSTKEYQEKMSPSQISQSKINKSPKNSAPQHMEYYSIPQYMEHYQAPSYTEHNYIFQHMEHLQESHQNISTKDLKSLYYNCELYRWIKAEWRPLDETKCKEIQPQYENILAKYDTKLPISFDKLEIDRANRWEHGTFAFNVYMLCKYGDLKESLPTSFEPYHPAIRFTAQDHQILFPKLGLQQYIHKYLQTIVK